LLIPFIRSPAATGLYVFVEVDTVRVRSSARPLLKWLLAAHYQYATSELGEELMLESFDFSGVAKDVGDALALFNAAFKAGQNVKGLFRKSKSTSTTGNSEADSVEHVITGVTAEEQSHIVPEEGNTMPNTDDTERLSEIETRIDTLEKAIQILANAVEQLGDAGSKNSDSITTLSSATESLSTAVQGLSGAVETHTSEISNLRRQ
jgi:predicted RNase H-like nuclease (RuvC/YqgF family)